MKKLLFVILAILVVSSVDAQILRSIARSAANQAKNSAEDRASDEVDKQVDKSVNKFFDNLMKSDTTKKESVENQEKSDESSSQPPESVARFMNSLGGKSDVKHKDVYSFSSQMVMVTEITDADGKKMDPVEYELAFSEKTSDAMFKVKGNSGDGNMVTIVDSENSCFLILTDKDGKKTGLATKFSTDSSKDEQEDNNEVNGETSDTEPDCRMTKAGNTKKISGYSCEEYRCETDEAVTVAWVSKEFGADINKLYGHNAWGGKYNTAGVDGMVIQYEMKSKKDKSSSVMTIKSVDMHKSSSFSMAGYEISGFNFNIK